MLITDFGVVMDVIMQYSKRGPTVIELLEDAFDYPELNEIIYLIKNSQKFEQVKKENERYAENEKMRQPQ